MAEYGERMGEALGIRKEGRIVKKYFVPEILKAAPFSIVFGIPYESRNDVVGFMMTRELAEKVCEFLNSQMENKS